MSERRPGPVRGLPPAELEARARAVLPPEVMAYYAAGAGQERTLASAEAAWSAYDLRPHVLAATGPPSTAVRVLGDTLRTPVLVAPAASQLLAHPDGECATAAGTADAGGLFVLSMRSSQPLEQVAAAAGAWWLQVYVLRDRGLTLELVRRAAAAGASALVLTGDTPVLGRREGGRRDRLLPPGRGPLAVLGRDPGVSPEQLEQDDLVGWDDVAVLAAESGLPVVVKGVLRGDDARRAAAAGAAGVVVSNHGGRQLDGVVPTARALPEVAEAAGSELEVYVDGGLRRGSDVLRALALGARAVLVGRPVLWALAVDGRAGVRDLLEDLTGDLAHALRLAGCAGPGEVDRSHVAGPLRSW